MVRGGACTNQKTPCLRGFRGAQWCVARCVHRFGLFVYGFYIAVFVLPTPFDAPLLLSLSQSGLSGSVEFTPS